MSVPLLPSSTAALREMREADERHVGAVTYAIQSVRGGPVKFGRAGTGAAVPRRLAALQTGHPDRLRVVRIWAGDYERLVHHVFRHERLRDDGEWFAPSGAVCEFSGAAVVGSSAVERTMQRAYDEGHAEGYAEGEVDGSYHLALAMGSVLNEREGIGVLADILLRELGPRRAVGLIESRADSDIAA